MSREQTSNRSSLGSLIGTKDLLKMVVGKISSQLLLFSVAIIVFLIISYFLFGSEGVWISIAILFVFTFGSLGYLFVEQKKKVEAGDPEVVHQHLSTKVESISNQNNDFVIDLWTTGDEQKPPLARDMSVVPKQKRNSTRYHIGEKIEINFRSSRNCYLTLLNIGTSGKLTILFPNRIHSDNYIQANKTYKIPGADYGFEYQLQGPAGTEKLKAIATLERVELVESQFTSEGVFKTAEGTAASRDISVVAKKLAPVATEMWSEASCRFELVA